LLELIPKETEEDDMQITFTTGFDDLISNEKKQHSSDDENHDDENGDHLGVDFGEFDEDELAAFDDAPNEIEDDSRDTPKIKSKKTSTKSIQKDDENDENEDAEITYTTDVNGLKKLISKKANSKSQEEDETVWDKYIEKKKR